LCVRLEKDRVAHDLRASTWKRRKTDRLERVEHAGPKRFALEARSGLAHLGSAPGLRNQEIHPERSAEIMPFGVVVAAPEGAELTLENPN
jgi:hypothetical protein